MKRSFPSSSSADSNRPFSLNISDLGDPDLAPFTKITLLEVIVYAMDGLQEMYLTILSRLQSGDAATWGITVSTVLFTSTMMYAFLYPAPADSSSGSHDDKEEKEEEEAIVMRDFTIQQLREFNGADNKPIYVALKGK